MVATNTNSQTNSSKPASGGLISERSGEPKPRRTSRSAPRKLLAVMAGLMDLMVDGLAPGVKRQRRAYESIVVGAGPAGTAAAICAASEGVDTLIVEAGQAERGATVIDAAIHAGVQDRSRSCCSMAARQPQRWPGTGASGLSCSIVGITSIWVTRSILSRILKTALVYHESDRTRMEAKSNLFEYMEVFYNRARKHSHLGYRSPVQFENLAHGKTI